LVKRNYELMFIINPELGEEETEALLERIRGYLLDVEGEIFFSDDWGVRRLAYAIEKHREGHYYLTRFAMEADKVQEFERRLMLTEGVLRTLLIRLDEKANAGAPPPTPPEATATPTE